MQSLPSWVWRLLPRWVLWPNLTLINAGLQMSLLFSEGKQFDFKQCFQESQELIRFLNIRNLPVWSSVKMFVNAKEWYCCFVMRGIFLHLWPLMAVRRYENVLEGEANSFKVCWDPDWGVIKNLSFLLAFSLVANKCNVMVVDEGKSMHRKTELFPAKCADFLFKI